MEIAVIGPRAHALRSLLPPRAQVFETPAAAVGTRWQLLALTHPDAADGCVLPRCGVLLLPGDCDTEAAYAAAPQQVVGYGFSPRDTLTLSSLTGDRALLCIQRGLVTLRGTLLEAQELPLPPRFAALPAQQALLLAGVDLLCCR